MHFTNILITFCLLGIIVCAIFYIAADKKEKNQSVDTIFAIKKKVGLNQWYKVYQIASKIPGIRGYVRKVRKQVEIFFPGDERIIVKTTTKIVASTAAVFIAAITILLVARPSLYMIMCAFVAIAVISNQLIQRFINNNETKLLKELNHFTELVQFNFLQTRMIDEAINDSLSGRYKLIERHGNEILKVIKSDDMESDLSKYNKTVSNRYLREFMCICITTFTYGDTETNGRSRFLESIKSMKSRIGAELTNREKVDFEFRFLPVICIAPMFFVEVAKAWGISVVSELESYYNGYYGLMATILCVMASVLAYFVVNYLKDSRLSDLNDHTTLKWLVNRRLFRKILSGYYNHNYGLYLQQERLLKQTGSRLNTHMLMMKRILYSITTFVVMVGLCIGMHQITKHRIDTEVTGTGSKSTMANEADSVLMMLMIRGYTEKFKTFDYKGAYNLAKEDETAEELTVTPKQWWKQKLIEEFQEGEGCTIEDDVALDTIKQYNNEHASSTILATAYLGTQKGAIRKPDTVMEEEGRALLRDFQEEAQGEDPLSTELYYESVAEDVINRVVDYQNAYFHWYEVLVAVILAILAFNVPMMWITFTRKDAERLMEDEVMQFQALILILMPIKEMSAQVMMDWMLVFSEIFRPSIHRCIVELSVDEEKAFNDLIKAEPYEPFQDLIRKMQMCDSVGVHKAFYSMDVTHKNFEEHRKQSSAMRVATNSSMANSLCVLPIIALAVIYVGVPFLVESFGQLDVVTKQMMEM